jgi:hypothetical protein
MHHKSTLTTLPLPAMLPATLNWRILSTATHPADSDPADGGGPPHLHILRLSEALKAGRPGGAEAGGETW